MLSTSKKWSNEHERILIENNLEHLIYRKSQLEKDEFKIKEIRETWGENYKKIPKGHPHHSWVSQKRNAKNGKGKYIWYDELNIVAAKYDMPDLFYIEKKSPISIENIKNWIKNHHKQTGKYPSVSSGIIILNDEEQKIFGKLTWNFINQCLTKGYRGLSKGESLSNFIKNEFEFISKYNNKDKNIKNKELLSLFIKFCEENNRVPQQQDFLLINEKSISIHSLEEKFRRKGLNFREFIANNLNNKFLIKYNFSFGPGGKPMRICYQEFKKLVREHNPTFTSGNDYRKRYFENPLFPAEPWNAYPEEWKKFGGWKDLIGIDEFEIRKRAHMKFPNETYIEIIKKFKKGISASILAQDYGYSSPTCIYRIVKNGIEYYLD